MSNRLFLIVVGLLLGAALVYEFATRETGFEGDMTIARLNETTVELNGTLGDASLSQLRRYILQNPGIQFLELGSMPGTVNKSMTLVMGRWVRKQGLDTQLTASSWIASGAVDLFLSGRERRIECGARIGVHAWGNTFGDLVISAEDNKNSWHANHQEDIRFFNYLGYDGQRLYDFIIGSASHDEIHYMSVEEMNRFGFSSVPLTC